MKNKAGGIFRRIAAVLLSLVLFCSSALAAVETVVDAEQKAQYLEQFNTAVNAIKTDKPYMKMTKTLALKKDGVTVGSENGSDLSDDAKKWLKILLDACFSSDSGVAEALILAISDTQKTNGATEFVYNQKRDNAVPLSGQSIVSALTAEDYFTLKLEEINSTGINAALEKTIVRFELLNQKLEDAQGSALAKIFDLPSGAIDPVIIGGTQSTDTNDSPLSELKFEEFMFKNAYAQVEYDSDGKLTKYTSSIDYSFELSFYDAMRLITAITGTDLMKIALSIANPILNFTGNKEIEARDILKSSTLYVNYNALVEISDINWDKRLFGDVDNNGKVDAYDAREALRHAVGLREIKNQMSQIYTDVDFDGLITSSDSRLILRMAVGLDNTFVEPPEGETIKIVIVEDTPSVPSEPENPEQSENPDEQEQDTKPQLDLSGFLGGITESILGIIDSVQGDGESIKNVIIDLVEQIKSAISQ